MKTLPTALLPTLLAATLLLLAATTGAARAAELRRPASRAATCDSALASPVAELIRLEPLGPGLWLVPGRPGDSDAANRGAISNLLLLADGPRTWLLGSGPSAAFGAALACRVQAELGRRISDVIAPWPRPELVLGQAGLPGVRRWAHADVAAAMRQRCPRCVERLQQRLGAAAPDLGRAPIALPQHLLHGMQGRLGPLQWWRLSRGNATPVTVWRLRDRPLWSAHGLLWADDAPDLRDSDFDAVMQATRQLQQLTGADGSATRWLPEQGPLQDGGAPQRQLDYGTALQQAVEAALERGDVETDPADPLAVLTSPPQPPRGLRHTLNWQRLWRQSEERLLAPPPASAAGR